MHTQYVARKRARFVGCNGQRVNIPFGSILIAEDGFLLWQGEPLCVETSENAHTYFSRNDDGQGQRRGELVTAILGRLAMPVVDDKKLRAQTQSRWDKVWADSLCKKYRRPEHKDYWLWSHEFYNAPVEDLCHIARVVGARV